MASIREIPGYAEAVAAERETRQDAWLSEEPDICGVAVDPLTPRKIVFLSLASNGYIMDSPDPSAYDMALFLWVVSGEFEPKADRKRAKFYKRLRKLDTLDLHAGITDYLARSYFDMPGACAENHTAAKVDWIPLFIHNLAESYGWSVAQCLDTPLRQTLQLRRCIQISTDPASHMHLRNPLSDRVAEDFLINANRAANS